MTLMKRSFMPSLLTDNWLTDFFDDARFFDSDLLKRTSYMPAVNVVEKDKEFEIKMAAPGLTKKDFNVVVENGVLTISCEKDMEKEEKDVNFTRREYSYTTFTRSFTLPENVKSEKVDAFYENGILRLVIPKIEEVKVKPKAIEIH